ncbi:MAG: hypothetical protein HC851_22875 [Acaryochloris sp. RU_4_1]|nr:hypothetical protein [Acaryochloris sp. RU_4_1]
MATQKRGALGNNPLNQGIFTKTVEAETVIAPTATIEPEATTPKTETIEIKQESRKKIKESRILIDSRTEKVNLRLSVKVNDWLDSLLKKGRRQHGHKIPKEVWVQAALELFQSMPVNWEEIESEEALKATLLNLESRLKNQENYGND